MPIHVLIQLLFKIHRNWKPSITLKKIQPTIHTQMQLTQFLLSNHHNLLNEAQWSTGKCRAICKYFLIENLFCVSAVSNLSWGLFSPHKTCKQVLHWSPWPRPLFFLLCTTTLPNYRSISLLSKSILLLLLLVTFITQSGTKNGEHTEIMDISQLS